MAEFLRGVIDRFESEPDARLLGALVQHFLDTYPWHADARHLLGMSRYLDNDLPGAAEQLSSAIVLAPENPAHWAALRAICAITGRGPAVTLIDHLLIPLRNMAAKRKPDSVLPPTTSEFWHR